MFNYVMGIPVCPQCKEKQEATFQRVKKFVQDNKKATIEEIVENCDVDSAQVKQWIREERLFFSDDSPVKISCELCGCQIPSGRFCDKCKKEAAGNFGNVLAANAARNKATAGKESLQRSSNAKMHIR